MDVDEDASQNLRGTTRGFPAPVILVDNNHPFDIEAYSSSYAGMMTPKHQLSATDNGEQVGRPWIVSCTSSTYVLRWRFQLCNLLYSTSLRPETSTCIGISPVPTMLWRQTHNYPLRQKSRLWIKRGTMNGRRRTLQKGQDLKWN